MCASAILTDSEHGSADAAIRPCALHVEVAFTLFDGGVLIERVVDGSIINTLNVEEFLIRRDLNIFQEFQLLVYTEAVVLHPFWLCTEVDFVGHRVAQMEVCRVFKEHVGLWVVRIVLVHLHP